MLLFSQGCIVEGRVVLGEGDTFPFDRVGHDDREPVLRPLSGFKGLGDRGHVAAVAMDNPWLREPVTAPIPGVFSMSGCP